MNGGRVRFPRPVRHLTSVSSGRDVWLAARRSGLGGSDIAAIIGASPPTSTRRWAGTSFHKITLTKAHAILRGAQP